MKKVRESKTIIFFGLLVVVSIANLLGFAEFVPSSQQDELFRLILGIAGVVLRFLTSKGVEL